MEFSLMKIQYIETHKYAPELNKAYIKGIPFKCPNIHSIKEIRTRYFKQVRRGRYAKIVVKNTEYNEYKVYQGYTDSNYSGVMAMKRYIKNRHNLPNTTVTIKTEFIG